MGSKKRFTPTIRTEKKLNIKIGHKLDHLKDKDGIIKTQLNNETVIQALSHKLYRNAESGFRELLNNEIRACQIAKDKYGSKNPYIKVSLNTLDRSLVIHGINSQGITLEVFEVLREIGSSITESKKGGRIPFGMGFYGSLKLSDIVFVQTRCIENDDCYGVQLKGGLHFEEIQEPTFKETGTRIKVTLKPRTNYEKIVETLVSVSKTSGVKTYFELKAHNGDIGDFSSGIHELETTTLRKIFDETKDDNYSYLTASIDNTEVEGYLSIAINSEGSLQDERNKKLFLVNSPIDAILDEQDYDDYDYEAENDDDNEGDGYNYDNNDDDKPKRIKYKASKIDEINFHSVVINMKKETVFPPHQDRERLTPVAEKKLREIVIQLYNDALKTIKQCRSFEDWYDHEHKYFISANKNDLIDLDQALDQKTKKLRTFLNTEVFSYQERKGISQVRELKQQLDLYHEDNLMLFYALRKDKRVYNILNDNFGDERVTEGNDSFIVHKGDYYLCLIDINKFEDEFLTSTFSIKKVNNKFKATKNILEHFGFVEAKAYIKEHGLKRLTKDVELTKDVDPETLVTLHSYNFDNHKDTISVEDEEFKRQKPNMIKVSGYLKYKALINEIPHHNLCLVIDDQSIEELSDIVTTNDVYQEIKKKKFLTNFGKLTVEEILQTFSKSTDIILNPRITKEDFILINRVPKIASRDKRVSQLYIIGNNRKNKKIENSKRTREEQDFSDYFKLGLVLIDNNRNYKVRDNSYDLDDFYRKSLKELKENLKDLIGHTDSYRDERIDDGSFDEVADFEKYLIRLKEVNEKVRNETLRKLFANGHTEDNYVEMIAKVLILNKLITPNKIKRKTTKEYL